MELTERLRWRGREVACTRVGDGPPVVLCHGTPWSSWLWARVAEDLGRHFTVHLWDMPGYGRSSKDPQHAVDLGTQGELLADLLREWGSPGPTARRRTSWHTITAGRSRCGRTCSTAWRWPRSAWSTWWRCGVPPRAG